MKITFIGGGNMASALIGGLLKQGFPPADISVVEPLAAARDQLGAKFAVRCTEAPDAQALDCDALVLAVKPQQMREACAALAGRLGRQVVISIAAGARLEDLGRWLGGHTRLVRTMPNTPALIGAGVTGLFAPAEVGPGEREAAQRIMRAVGETVWIDDESKMDGVTAVSGSGPAYVFYFIEALRDAARGLGFSDEQALQLSLATFEGAVRLARQGGEDVSVLRQRVTSKGGTTEAALKVMQAEGVAASIEKAVAAAESRGRELGIEMGREPGTGGR